MAENEPPLLRLGMRAADFALAGVDGRTHTLGDVRGRNGTLVAFICNHCPYVKAIVGRFVAEAQALQALGVGSIAIMPNDTTAYPADSFANMHAFARQHGFTFPYVIDANAGRRPRLWGRVHARFLRFQRRAGTCLPWPPRRIAHDFATRYAARALRGHGLDRADGPRAGRAAPERRLLDQVAAVMSACAAHPSRRRRPQTLSNRCRRPLDLVRTTDSISLLSIPMSCKT